MQRKDLTNRRFGLLTATSPSRVRWGSHTMWLCVCDCGEQCEASTAGLTSGNNRSCGCQGKGYRRPSSRSVSLPCPSVFSQVRHGAESRGIPFHLTKDFVDEMSMQPCYICGVEGRPLNGIDRVDNTVGYIESNCAPCCKEHNSAKCSLELKDMQTILDYARERGLI